MSSLLILSPVALLVLSAIYFLVAEWRSARVAYFAVAWLPLALLLFMFIRWEYMVRTLSYGIILLGASVAGSSLLLGAVGVILLIRAKRQSEPRLALSVFTIAAIAPALIFAGMLLE